MTYTSQPENETFLKNSEIEIRDEALFINSKKLPWRASISSGNLTMKKTSLLEVKIVGIIITAIFWAIIYSLFRLENFYEVIGRAWFPTVVTIFISYFTMAITINTEELKITDGELLYSLYPLKLPFTNVRSKTNEIKNIIFETFKYKGNYRYYIYAYQPVTKNNAQKLKIYKGYEVEEIWALGNMIKNHLKIDTLATEIDWSIYETQLSMINSKSNN